MDFDKSNSKIFINYFVEDFKIAIKIPLKDEHIDKNNEIIFDKFDISNKIFLANIIQFEFENTA